MPMMRILAILFLSYLSIVTSSPLNPFSKDDSLIRSSWSETNTSLACMYMTSEPNWGGQQENLCETAGQCAPQLPTGLSGNVSSAGPSEGQTCFLYSATNCTGNSSAPIVYPGYSNLSTIDFDKLAMSWRCWKMCGYVVGSNGTSETTVMRTETSAASTASDSSASSSSSSLSITQTMTETFAQGPVGGPSRSITLTVTEAESSSSTSSTSHSITRTITQAAIKPSSSKSVSITHTITDSVLASSSSSSTPLSSTTSVSITRTLSAESSPSSTSSSSADSTTTTTTTSPSSTSESITRTITDSLTSSTSSDTIIDSITHTITGPHRMVRDAAPDRVVITTTLSGSQPSVAPTSSASSTTAVTGISTTLTAAPASSEAK